MLHDVFGGGVQGRIAGLLCLFMTGTVVAYTLVCAVCTVLA